MASTSGPGGWRSTSPSSWPWNVSASSLRGLSGAGTVRPMALSTGDKAPAISLLDQTESKVKLSDYKGRKVLVFFYRSEEHTSELQSLMRISYAVFCLKK